jgi:hypothetical protein
MRRIIHHLAVVIALVSLATGATTRPPAAAQCPTVTIDRSANIVCAGEPTTFTATIEGGDPNLQSKFKWTLSAGTITDGQGTSTITVDTKGLGGQSITATVEIDDVSAMTPDCAKTASCVRQVGICDVERKFDEYGEILLQKEAERLDNFALQLKNEPGTRGIVIVYGRFGYTRGDIQARANRAKDYLVTKHEIEAERIVIVTGGNVEESTVELWLDIPSNKFTPGANRTDTVEPLEP